MNWKGVARNAKYLNAFSSIAVSTYEIAECETRDRPPRHIQKIISICILYSIRFWISSRPSRVAIGPMVGEPIPDELVSASTSRNESFCGRADGELCRQRNAISGRAYGGMVGDTSFLEGCIGVRGGFEGSVPGGPILGWRRSPSHPSLSRARDVCCRQPAA